MTAKAADESHLRRLDGSRCLAWAGPGWTGLSSLSTASLETAQVAQHQQQKVATQLLSQVTTAFSQSATAAHATLATCNYSKRTPLAVLFSFCCILFCFALFVYVFFFFVFCNFCHSYSGQTWPGNLILKACQTAAANSCSIWLVVGES